MVTYNKDLARQLRKRGLKVKEVRGWSTRGHGGMTDVKGIVVHHTAGPKKGNIPSLPVLVHGRPGLSGPLCNLGLARNGDVYVVAGGLAYHAGRPDPADSEGVKRTHTTSGNSNLIGIEMESAGLGDWTDAEIDTMVPLLAALCRAYSLSPSTIVAHREWAPRRKNDPRGIAMNKLRAAVAYELTSPKRSKVDYGRPASKAEILKCRATGKLVPDGKLGPRTVRVLERSLGIPLRQRTNKLDVNALGELAVRLRVTRSRVLSPALIRALQQRVGVETTGTLSIRTVRALQRYLNRHKKF